MADFTSALYLGLRHPSGTLAPWPALTGGRPALLEEPPGATALAAGLAALQGTEQALLLPSTLHLFLDLFTLLATPGTVICLDAGAYPIAGWGVAQAACTGVPVHRFRQHDPAALARVLAHTAARQPTTGRPIVVADGLCPSRWEGAPLAEYLQLVRRYQGLLVVDDTQALGILGVRPTARLPYGRGGGGSLRYAGLHGGDILIGASLAKGFGVPLAALSGSAGLLRRVAAQSPTRLHCSPPSVAAIAAGVRALAINRTDGETLRARLLRQVWRFRAGLGRLGLTAAGGDSPVQALRLAPGVDAPTLHRRLHRLGVRCLVMRPGGAERATLGFLITAAHRDHEIDGCLAALAEALPSRPRSEHQRPRFLTTAPRLELRHVR